MTIEELAKEVAELRKRVALLEAEVRELKRDSGVIVPPPREPNRVVDCTFGRKKER